MAQKDGSLALTHVVQIQNDETGAWFEAFVDAHTGELVQLTDFVAKASVRANILKYIILDSNQNDCYTVSRIAHHEGDPY